MLKARVFTALVLLALLLAALFWSPAWLWSALVTLLVLQSLAEWARLSGLSATQARIYWLAGLLTLLLLFWLEGYIAAAWLHLPWYLLSAVLWLVVVPSWLISGWKARQRGFLAAVGWVVVVPAGLAMLDLRAAAPAPWMLLLVMGLVWVADSAAYFAGRSLGKTKLAPAISPGKTWEGVIGAMAGVAVYVLLVWSFSPALQGYGLLLMLEMTAMLWVALAVIGDLFESAIKRQAGVKDSGALLPGHGGLLDRIDALTSTLPLAALAMLLQGGM